MVMIFMYGNYPMFKALNRTFEEIIENWGREMYENEWFGNFGLFRFPGGESIIEGGNRFYEELKAKGILVRHFTKEKICDYSRITIGSLDEMKALIEALKTIVKE